MNSRIEFTGVLYGRNHLAGELACDPDLADYDLVERAFAKWGRDCPRYLNGDFAFSISESEVGSTYCARDHIGARPLYYTVQDGRLLHAASVRELLHQLPRPPELDEQFVATTLQDRRFHSKERTCYQGIHKLAPGHWMEFRDGSLEIGCYWRADQVEPLSLVNDDAYLARGRELLTAAVNERVPASGQLGVHVTGGLDSSSIAALAVQQTRAAGQPDPLGLAWHAGGPDLAKSNLIEVMRRALDIEVAVPAQTVAGLLALLKLDLTQDFEAHDLLHEDAIQREASAREVKVILSGWGGDETITYNGRGLAEQYWRTGQWGKLAELGRGGGLRGFAQGLSAMRQERQLIAGKQGDRKRLSQGFANPALLDRVDLIAPTDFRAARNAREMQLALHALGHTTARLENWAESGRRHGVEYRYPMLDRRVMEFALAIPPELFRRGRVRRWFFREMTQGLLPDEVRLHESKLERQRGEELLVMLRQAMLQINQSMGDDASFKRARFLDMPRLRDTLRELEHGKLKLQGPLRTALQFLDL